MIEHHAPLVFIGNNTYDLDGLHLGKRKRLDAGHLSIHIIDRTDRRGLVLVAARALAGRLRETHDFETLCATPIELTTRKGHATVATDGEIERLAMPLVYELDRRPLVPNDGGESDT